ncbi:MAG TPA: hypothetical protein V6D08_00065 [Candidatus Obscuribacterales bacterium]
MASRATGLIFGLALTLLCASAARADGGEAARKAAMVPVRLAAFATGVVFGTPIAIVRKIAENTADATKSAAGGSDNKLKLAAGSLVGLPVGIFTGSLEGAWLGWSNSWEHSSEKPFGKESFSLGELKE